MDSSQGRGRGGGDLRGHSGSRGSLSYLVKPAGDGESHAWSLAHGAGRKWSRSDARQRMRERYSVSELAQTPLGGRVMCEERDLLYEEAPAAYKNIEAVIADLVAADWCPSSRRCGRSSLTRRASFAASASLPARLGPSPGSNRGHRVNAGR